MSGAQPESAAAAAYNHASFFGASVGKSDTNRYANFATYGGEAHVSWTRYEIFWDDWMLRKTTTQTLITNELGTLIANGFTPIIMIRRVPSGDDLKKIGIQVEHRLRPALACSPMLPSYYDTYANYAAEIVTFSKSLGARYWQIGNEPDVDYTKLNPAEGDKYGQDCWGDNTASYFGGYEYAKYLTKVKTKIRQADSSAKIVVGGLQLAWQFTNVPDTDPQKSHQGNDPLFFEGILKYQQDNHFSDLFDIVDVHAYSARVNTTRTDWEANPADQNWLNGDGITRNKIQFVRTKLAAYNITNKAIIVGEAAIKCYTPNCIVDGDSSFFLYDQARYVAHVYPRVMAMNSTPDTNKVIGMSWWSMQKGILFYSDLTYNIDDLNEVRAPQSRPAYQTYRLLARLFQDATVAYPLNVGSNIEAYEVRPSGEYRYRIYWTNTATLQTISIPDTDRCTEAVRYSYAWDSNSTYGNVNGGLGTINVNFDPQIVRCRSLDTAQWDNTPGVASWGVGRIDTFVRTSTSTLAHNWVDGAGWHPWEAVPNGPTAGTVDSVTTAVSWGAGRIDVFWKSSTNQLMHQTFNGAWSSPEPFEGGMDSPPTVTTWGPNRLDVFWRGMDDHLWRKQFDGVWHPAAVVNNGTLLNSAPAAVSWGVDRIDVFWKGADTTLQHGYFTGSGATAWSGVESLGGVLQSAPTVSTWGPNRLDVFWRDPSNHLAHKWIDGGWMPIETFYNTTLTSAPSAVSWGVNRIDIFWSGSGPVLQHKYLNGVGSSAWSSVESLNGWAYP